MKIDYYTDMRAPVQPTQKDVDSLKLGTGIHLLGSKAMAALYK